MSEGDPGRPIRLELDRPAGAAPSGQRWTVVAYSKSVLAQWNRLCTETPQDAIRCWEWLARDAMSLARPKRCYPLRGKPNAGAWCYEIGSGNRVYYMPDRVTLKATLYYAGHHPSKAPSPPRELE